MQAFLYLKSQVNLGHISESENLGCNYFIFRTKPISQSYYSLPYSILIDFLTLFLDAFYSTTNPIYYTYNYTVKNHTINDIFENDTDIEIGQFFYDCFNENLLSIGLVSTN